jgi:hypothetical protein
MIMSYRLFVIAAFAIFMSVVSAVQAATTSVEVVNGRGAPALVMDQTVLRPVQGNATRRLEAGHRFADLELITPPEGKMVVIEYITIRVFAEEETANALVELQGDLGEGAGIEHSLEAFPASISLGVLTVFQQTLTQHVLFYSTGPVGLEIDRGRKNAKLGIFEVAFSGYLVNAPEES